MRQLQIHPLEEWGLFNVIDLAVNWGEDGDDYLETEGTIEESYI